MGLTFVVADDGLIPRDRLRQYLTSSGHEVVGAADNGKTALEMCRTLRPDAVILDIVMPQMSGDNAALIILDEQLVKHVFVASLSVQEAIIGKLTARGVRVVAKPYRQAQLMAEIAGTIE